MTDPHGQEPYPRWLSAAKVVYLFCDYAAGWVLRIAPSLRRGGWVVLERGWFDLAVDARRYRLRGVAPLVRGLGCLLPRPGVTLVLRAPLSVLLARTVDDIAPEEVARQQAVFDTLYARLPGTVFLDATRPPGAVCDDAVRALGERLGLVRR